MVAFADQHRCELPYLCPRESASPTSPNPQVARIYESARNCYIPVCEGRRGGSMFRKTAVPALEYIFFALNRLQGPLLLPSPETTSPLCHQGIGLAHSAMRNIARGTALFFSSSVTERCVRFFLLRSAMNCFLPQLSNSFLFFAFSSTRTRNRRTTAIGE